jgi:hypothetical protein
MFGLGWQEIVILLVIVIIVAAAVAVVWSLVTIARNVARSNRNRRPEPPA